MIKKERTATSPGSLRRVETFVITITEIGNYTQGISHSRAKSGVRGYFRDVVRLIA